MFSQSNWMITSWLCSEDVLQMKQGVLERVWSFQGPKLAVAKKKKKLSLVRANRLLDFGVQLSTGGTWQFSISVSMTLLWPLNVVTHWMIWCLLCVLWFCQGWKGPRCCFLVLSNFLSFHPILWNEMLFVMQEDSAAFKCRLGFNKESARRPGDVAQG